MDLRETAKPSLRKIVAAHPEALRDREKLQTLLRDHGQNSRETGVLLMAFDQSIPNRLLNPNPGVPPEVNTAKLTSLLHQNRLMEKDAAEWAVSSWAAALQVGPATVHAPLPATPDVPAVPHNVANAFIAGRKPSAFKIRFHGERLWGLLFGLFVASRILNASSSLRTSLTDFYQDYPAVVWIALTLVFLFTTFSAERRFKPLF